jgi:SSS family solute:Na+ symporter
LVIALLAAKPLLGDFEQAFQYIQEFTGFFTPGIVVLFFMGMFWRKTTADAALAAAIGSAVFSLLCYVFWPTLPFMDRVGVVFLLCLVVAIVVSLWQAKTATRTAQTMPSGAVVLDDINFATSAGFNFAMMLVVLILIVFYTLWW